MKKINNFISEKLHIRHNMKSFDYFPENKSELEAIIDRRLKLAGNSADLNNIDVSKIPNLSYLFKKFPQIENIKIDEWDTSKMTNAKHMFEGCKKFNCDLSKWDVSKLQDASYMFSGCSKFNQDLSNWKIDNLLDCSCIFYKCSSLQYNMEKWGERLSEDCKYNYAFVATNLKHTPSWYLKP